MSSRDEKIPVYAHHGSDAFNKELHDVLNDLSQDVISALGGGLVALILGGGYGRGEGGVFCRDDEERPYNDLDLVLLVAGELSNTEAGALKLISEKYEHILGIHVDFSRPFTEEEIRRWPTTLMWQDLVNGHIVLHGSPGALKELSPGSMSAALPLVEATRLLLNRGEGLLWALHIVKGFELNHDEDLIRRNYHKCGLALGDALLIADGSYTTKYTGRDHLVKESLRSLPELSSLGILDVYTQALLFKFKPNDVPEKQPCEADLLQMAGLWGKVFLHIERERVSMGFDSLDEYCRWNGIRESSEHHFSKLPRNLIRSWQNGVFSWKYPREVLYRKLPVLLGLTNTSVNNWNLETEKFIRLWEKFNG